MLEQRSKTGDRDVGHAGALAAAAAADETITINAMNNR